MERRKGEAKTKAAIVRQELKGKLVKLVYPEHQISLTKYYQ